MANENINYHISWLGKAIDNYEGTIISGNMTIQDFIETTCKDILNDVVEQTD